MNAQRTAQRVTGLVVAQLATLLGLAACSNTSMQPPAGTSGSAGTSLPGGTASAPASSAGRGSAGTSSAGPSAGPSPAGAATTGATAPGGTGTAGGLGRPGGTGAVEDPGAVFDKSLGDFDGEIGRERDAMAKSGQGSGRAAETRQDSDSTSVRTAGGPRVNESGMGGSGGVGPPGVRVGGQTPGTPGGQVGDAPAGVGPDGEPGTPDDTPATREAGPGGSGTPAPDVGGAGQAGAGGSGGAGDALPADIPRDSSSEDQVARQLREAALAESDPAIREALWDEYRKVMGIKKK